MEIRVVYLLKSKYFCNYKLHHNRFAKQHRDSIVEIILAEIISDSDIELLRIQKVQITFFYLFFSPITSNIYIYIFIQSMSSCSLLSIIYIYILYIYQKAIIKRII